MVIRGVGGAVVYERLWPFGVPTGLIVLGTTPLLTIRWTTSTVTGAEGPRRATFPTRRRTPCQRGVKRATMLPLKKESHCGILPTMHLSRIFGHSIPTSE